MLFRSKNRLYISIFTAAALLAGACGGEEKTTPADALARVGNEYLTAGELSVVIPAGLNHDDSTTFAKAYIRDWIDSRLIERVAAAEVDLEQIDRLVAQYRDELIMSQYRRAMAEQADNEDFAEDSLKAYYDAHKTDFVLERPMLKGVYLKVPTDAPKLSQIKRLYRSDKPDDIDKLEKAAIGTAIHYDYFRDTWIDMEQIETKIPVDFPAAGADIAQRRYLETDYQGFTYLLSVSDYLAAGSPMPFEAARPLIRERMLNLKRRAYDSRLRNDLYNRALDDGTLVVY